MSSQAPQCDDLIRKAPKVELHVHLDGSFDTSTLFQAAKKFQDELPESIVTPWDGKSLPVKANICGCCDEKSFEAFVAMGPEPKGLFPMLDCFYTFLPIVRGRMDVLEELSMQFVRRQAEQNVVYTEVRYSPHELLAVDAQGQIIPGRETARMAVEAVCRGLKRGLEQFPHLVVRQLLCCINFRPEWSAEVVELAKEFQSQGVVGVDIASGENHLEDAPDGPLHTGHRSAMGTAQKYAIPITVHAGEVGPPEHVKLAIEAYGAQRIGHGYRCIGTAAYDFAREKGVHFEMCPTSSVATKGVDSFEAHPLKKLCCDRCSCSISTDDPAVFRTGLSDELEKCATYIGISHADMAWMTLEGVKAAFGLSADDRSALEKKVRDYYVAAGVTC